MRRIFFIVLVALLYTSLGSAQAGMLPGGKPAAAPDTLPVPKNVKDMKFFVQRDPNSNTVVYELNKTAQGSLDEKDPIHPFWIRYAEDGAQKELNYIQRKFAYGLNTKKTGTDSYELRFVCYSKLVLRLRKGPDSKYNVYTTINQKEAILDRVFVRIEGGTFWVPNVLYVELKGRDAVTGKALAGRFKP
ncbi:MULTISPECIES: DUF4833 domain-containing protein [Pontibacter]|uniref:DUF4833 domain-containing protein n=2 Tax=Pontibacter TaxID=323449 RepID=A0A239JCW8_9BACT|nr:DUF4833 domain-containing protein [Pontibacter ummariensis]PRY08365.1 uncharacterized protein DUF4833 [Pontibacter ummariensis]SNT03695.1 protein of unknown function [Pontibacter ummariensis]